MEAGAVQTTQMATENLKRLVISVAKLKLSPEEISDHASLFEDCGIDSTSLIELVLSIEEKYGVAFTEDELEIEMFQDLSKLAGFIDSKRASQA
ncbi:MAG TPA: acyl carrier protein [Candidatus Angelobacter sp.]|nr:acyl carrier protein [Candidatus Angelobacter sp.]